MRDFQVFDVAVAPGVAKTSPQQTNLSMPTRIVRAVDIVIPLGVRATAGIALGLAGQAIIPSNAGAFITGDGEVVHFSADGYPDSGSWQAFTYNTGLFTHTFEIRFYLDLPQDSLKSRSLLPLSASLIGG